MSEKLPADSSTANYGGFEETDSPMPIQQLRVAGASQMVSGRNADKKKVKCIWLTTIGDAPHTDQLIQRLKIKLDPPKSLGGDVKSLADKFGYSNSDIHFLTSKSYGSPTETLLQDKGDCTLVELVRKLQSIGREDVVVKVEEYIDSHECKCEDCSIIDTC